MRDRAGDVASASAGTSAAEPHQQPVQIGLSGFPCSNSIHTPAPTGGMVNIPVCGPPSGRQGMAHEDGVVPKTSGTCDWIRPVFIGSTLLTTVPRYLP